MYFSGDILAKLNLDKPSLEKCVSEFVLQPDGTPKSKSASKEDLTAFLSSKFPSVHLEREDYVDLRSKTNTLIRRLHGCWKKK